MRSRARCVLRGLRGEALRPSGGPQVYLERTRDISRRIPDRIYRGVVNDIEAPLHRGWSDQRMQEFRARTLLLEPGDQGQSSVRSEACTPLKMLLGVTGSCC